MMDDYPDGVWLVELAPIADARMVPQAIASVLGVKEETGRPVSEALIKAVRDRRLLLILDNCEHLLQACADTCRQLAPGRPASPDPRLEPRAAARRGRDDVSAAGARHARRRSDGGALGAGPIRGRAPLRRPRGRRAAVLSRDRPERDGGGRHLPPPRRHPARDRARGGPRSRACRSRPSRSA